LVLAEALGYGKFYEWDLPVVDCKRSTSLFGLTTRFSGTPEPGG